MGRPPMFGPKIKTWAVLAMLSGEIIVAGAASREKVFERSSGRQKVDFPEAGKTVLAG